jgi:protein-disulfide isomerase
MPLILALGAVALVSALFLGGLGIYAAASRSGGSATNTPQSGQNLGAVVAPNAADLTPASIPSSGRTLGDPNAPHTLEVWVDFQCGACRDYSVDTQPQIVANYVLTGKVKIVFHDFIVVDSYAGGTESLDAANAAYCAADQGQFWLYHDWLFANQGVAEGSGAYSKDRLEAIAVAAGIHDTSTFDACVAGGIHNAEISAETIPDSAIGTPTITIDGGEPLLDWDYDTVSAAIDAAGQ